MKEKKIKPLDHLDPKSFSWKLMNYAVSALICHDIHRFLADVGLEISGKSAPFKSTEDNYAADSNGLEDLFCYKVTA